MNRRVIGPPVQLAGHLAPVDHPQMLPSSPHRMPAPGERVARRVEQGLLYGPGAVPVENVPAAMSVNAFEQHRYAQLIEGNINVPTVPSGSPFITQSESRRNLLILRNASGVGGPDIYIGFGSEASAISAIVLRAQQYALFDVVVPQNDLFCLASAAGGVLVYAFSTFVPTGE